MKTTIILFAALLIGCEYSQRAASIDTAKVDATKWSVKATEWPLGESRYCLFFAEGFAGCWEQRDDSKGENYNRDDHPNDHEYLMRATFPEKVKQALAQGHNQKVYCARDESMHLSCPYGF